MTMTTSPEARIADLEDSRNNLIRYIQDIEWHLLLDRYPNLAQISRWAADAALDDGDLPGTIANRTDGDMRVPVFDPDATAPESEGGEP